MLVKDLVEAARCCYVQISTNPCLNERGSVLTQALFDDEVIQLVTFGEVEQVFSGALSERQVNLTRVEEQLDDILFHLQLFDVAREYGAE